MHDQDVRHRRRKENRIWRYALLASVLLHVLVLLLGGGRPIPLSPFAAAGPQTGDNRAARGGVQALNVRTPPPQPIERPVRPKPVEFDFEPIDFSLERAFEEAAFIGDDPGAVNAGTATGEGTGDGGTAEEGLMTVLAPSPRGITIPHDPPRSVAGVDVKVWVFVNEFGEVVADSTRLEPPTRDRRYNERLLKVASEWVFRPATRGGLPIAAWFAYTVEN